ncbi:MAG: N-acetyltransferase [Maricaulis sp.]|nr:N-acetyltransferase [Maricaulis sp.]HAQ34454.1 N-acetyltransferase [Alphaproteobacteria bacterium]
MTDTSNLDVRHEQGETRGRFVIDLEDGAEAELTYSRAGTDRWIADHTGVPRAYEGRGIASQLTRALVAEARTSGVKIVPLCPYIAAWFRKHPGESDLIA